jgi:tRNA (guanine-N7-)-methyltransferase
MQNDRTTLLIGDQEWELRVAIPGRILPEAQWSEVAKEAPLPGRAISAADVAPAGFAGPVVLDLGCGNGRFALLSSLARPGMAHVAIDSDPMHLRYLRRRLRHRGVTNVRLFSGDAADLLARLEPGIAAEIHAYHPQPWHEPGLSHRRLFHPPFQLDAHRALTEGGRLFVQTDSKPYSNYLRGTLRFLFELRELAEDEPWPDGLGKPRGRRELVAAQERLSIWRGVCIKRPLSAEEAAQIAAKLPTPDFQSDRKASPHRRRKVNRGEEIRG